jgi:hypothetical protein
VNEPAPKQEGTFDAGAGEAAASLFADLVLRQTQMALLLLGKVPHPEPGKSYRDLDQARLAIDQLAVLELKTKGNLTNDEAALLKQSLMTLRLAFVEAVEAAPAEAKSGTETQAAAAGPAPPTPPGAEAGAATAPTTEEPRKKFSKKY